MNWDVQVESINFVVVKCLLIPYTRNKILLVKFTSADSLVIIEIVLCYLKWMYMYCF